MGHHAVVRPDFTYNTDFAQVEDDEAQVNLTRFSLFFPEKREFFLEGQDIFGSGAGMVEAVAAAAVAVAVAGRWRWRWRQQPAPLLFYSRRIGLSNGLRSLFLAARALLGDEPGLPGGSLQMRTEDGRRGTPATDFSVLRINKRRAAAKPSRHDRDAARTRVDAGVTDNFAYGADALFNVQTNLSMSRILGGDRDPGQDRPQPSYRGAFNWNADRRACRSSICTSATTSTRRSVFSAARRSADRTARPVSARARRSVRGVRKLFFEGSMDYYDETGGTVESREAQATFRDRADNGDQVSLEYTDALRAPRPAASTVPGRVDPAGRLPFSGAEPQ